MYRPTNWPLPCLPFLPFADGIDGARPQITGTAPTNKHPEAAQNDASRREQAAKTSSNPHLSLLGLLLSLEVLEGAVRKSTSNENNGVETDSETSALLALRVDGTGQRSLGSRVASLLDRNNWLAWERSEPRVDYVTVLWRGVHGRDIYNVKRAKGEGTYLALQCADLELLERLPSLVAVTNVLESLGGILAGNI